MMMRVQTMRLCPLLSQSGNQTAEGAKLSSSQAPTSLTSLMTATYGHMVGVSVCYISSGFFGKAES